MDSTTQRRDERISELKDRTVEIETGKKTRMKTEMNRASGTCGMIKKKSKSCVIRVPDRKENASRSVKILEEIRSKLFQIWQET